MKILLALMTMLYASIGLAQTSVFIDVRTASEFQQGHVEGAQLIPYDRIAEGIAELQPGMDTTLYLYCRSGRRAGIAQEALQSMGYTRVINLETLDNARQTSATLQLCAKSSDAPDCSMPGMPRETGPAASAPREG